MKKYIIFHPKRFIKFPSLRVPIYHPLEGAGMVWRNITFQHTARFFFEGSVVSWLQTGSWNIFAWMGPCFLVKGRLIVHDRCISGQNFGSPRLPNTLWGGIWTGTTYLEHQTSGGMTGRIGIVPEILMPFWVYIWFTSFVLNFESLWRRAVWDPRPPEFSNDLTTENPRKRYNFSENCLKESQELKNPNPRWFKWSFDFSGEGHLALWRVT